MPRWRSKNRNGKVRDTLSRNERMAEPGFVMRNDERCPDCLTNELSGLQVNPKPTLVPSLSRDHKATCGNCRGYGSVPVRGKRRLDPYMTPKAING